MEENLRYDIYTIRNTVLLGSKILLKAQIEPLH